MVGEQCYVGYNTWLGFGVYLDLRGVSMLGGHIGKRRSVFTALPPPRTKASRNNLPWLAGARLVADRFKENLAWMGLIFLNIKIYIKIDQKFPDTFSECQNVCLTKKEYGVRTFFGCCT